MSTTEQSELLNRIFSEPNLKGIEKEVLALNTSKNSWDLFKFLADNEDTSSSSCYPSTSSESSTYSSENRLYNRGRRRHSEYPRSTLSRDAPEFVPASYASAVASGLKTVEVKNGNNEEHKVPAMPTQRFVSLTGPPPPRTSSRQRPSSNHARSVNYITLNNRPRPPVRMKPNNSNNHGYSQGPYRRYSLPPSYQTTYQASASNAGFPGRRSPAPKHCVHCKSIGEDADQYQSHCLKNPLTNKIICPILRNYECEICGATGDNAHGESRCPLNLINKESAKSFFENRMKVRNGLQEHKR